MQKLYEKNNSDLELAHQQRIVEDLFLRERQRQNWRLFFAFLLLLLIYSLMAFVVLPAVGLAKGSDSKIIDQFSAGRNDTAVHSEIEMLKGQMRALITGAMEVKVARLEKSIRNGIIRKSDVDIVEGLKTDMQMLKTHSLQKSMQSVGFTSPKTIGRSTINTAELSDAVLQEVLQIQTLYYLSIASCGLALFVIGGAWFFSSFRLKQLECYHRRQETLLEKPNLDIY